MKHLQPKYWLSFALAITLFLQARPVSTSVQSASFFQYSGDGLITFYDARTKESLRLQYRDAQGRYQPEALKQIDQFLACRESREVMPISLKLIELIDYVQDHFHVPEVEVVSAYRSPEYNTALRKRLRRVARHSMHLNGRAMDLRLPGVASRELRNYAISLKAGGVGYYGANRSVHIDTGPVRTW